MKKINHIVSMVILVCFIFNTAVQDLAFGQPLNSTDNLSTPKVTSNIMGPGELDKNFITFWLSAALKTMQLRGLEINREGFMKMVDELKKSEIFSPKGAQFFIHEASEIGDGRRMMVMVRLRESPEKGNFTHGLRTYYAVFPREWDKEEVPSIKVYTDKGYKGLLTKGLLVKDTKEAKEASAGQVSRALASETEDLIERKKINNIYHQATNPVGRYIAGYNLSLFTHPDNFKARMNEFRNVVKDAFNSLAPYEKKNILYSLSYLTLLLSSPVIRSYVLLNPKYNKRLTDKDIDAEVQRILELLSELASMPQYSDTRATVLGEISDTRKFENERLAKQVVAEWVDQLAHIQLKDVKQPLNGENPGIGLLAEWTKEAPKGSLREWAEYWKGKVSSSHWLRIKQLTGEISGNDYGPGTSMLIAFGVDLVMMNPTLAIRALAENEDLQKKSDEFVAGNINLRKWELLAGATKVVGEEARVALRAIFHLTNGRRGRVSFQVNARNYNRRQEMTEDILRLGKELDEEAKDMDSRLFLRDVLTNEELKATEGRTHTFFKVDSSSPLVYGEMEKRILAYLKGHRNDLKLASIETGGVIEEVLANGRDVNGTVAGSVADGVALWFAQMIGHRKAAQNGYAVHASIITKMAGRIEGALRWYAIQKVIKALGLKEEDELVQYLRKLDTTKNGMLDDERLRQAAKSVGITLSSDRALRRVGPAISQRSNEILNALNSRFTTQGVEPWETGDLLAATREPYSEDGRDVFAHLEYTGGMYSRGWFPRMQYYIESMPEEAFNTYLKELTKFLKNNPAGIYKPVEPELIEEVLRSSIGDEFRKVYELNRNQAEILKRLGIYKETWGSRGLEVKDFAGHPFAQQTLFGRVYWAPEYGYSENIPETEKEKDAVKTGFVADCNNLAAELEEKAEAIKSRASASGILPRLRVMENKEATAKWVARQIVNEVKDNPNTVLGLATGGTQIPVYEEIIKLTQKENVNWSGVTTFNLDEYLGIAPKHPERYRNYMNVNLFDDLVTYGKLNMSKTHLPEMNSDEAPEQAMERYVADIRNARGVKLWLLGMGSDGHYAFLEPAALIGMEESALLRGNLDYQNAAYPLIKKIRDFNEFMISKEIGAGYEAIKETIMSILNFQGKCRDNLSIYDDLVSNRIGMAEKAAELGSGKKISRKKARKELEKLGKRMLPESEVTFYVPLPIQDRMRLQLELAQNYRLRVTVLGEEDYFGSAAKVVSLALPTIIDNSRFFADVNEVPLRAFTATGVVRESERIIQHITKKEIAPALSNMLELQEPTPECPSTILLRHHKLEIVATEAAASRLSETTIAKYLASASGSVEVTDLGEGSGIRVYIRINNGNLSANFTAKDAVELANGLRQHVPLTGFQVRHSEGVVEMQRNNDNPPVQVEFNAGPQAVEEALRTVLGIEEKAEAGRDSASGIIEGGDVTYFIDNVLKDVPEQYKKAAGNILKDARITSRLPWTTVSVIPTTVTNRSSGEPEWSQKVNIKISNPADDRGRYLLFVLGEYIGEYSTCNYVEVRLTSPTNGRDIEIFYKPFVSNEMEYVLKSALDKGTEYNGFETWPATSQGAASPEDKGRASASGVQKEIAEMVALASSEDLIRQIPTHQSERYTLLMTEEFFANGNFEEHKLKYGDRFDLDRVSGRSPEQFIENVLAKAKGVETRTVVLVPDNLTPEYLEKLTSSGIRFVRTNITMLLKARADKDQYREKFQLDTYAMMLLIRRIDKDIAPDSSLYKLLSFYLKSHFELTDKLAVADYISAIVNNDIARLIKGYLTYRPIKPYDAKVEYENIAKALISA